MFEKPMTDISIRISGRAGRITPDRLRRWNAHGTYEHVSRHRRRFRAMAT